MKWKETGLPPFDELIEHLPDHFDRRLATLLDLYCAGLEPELPVFTLNEMRENFGLTPYDPKATYNYSVLIDEDLARCIAQYLRDTVNFWMEKEEESDPYPPEFGTW